MQTVAKEDDVVMKDWMENFRPVRQRTVRSTLVPEVFLIFHRISRSCERAAKREHESRSGEKEKPLVTLDLNLTVMQTPAVKRVNLIIQNGTNGSLAITCLSATNVSTRVVRSGIF